MHLERSVCYKKGVLKMKTMRGFTLIEILVALLIVGILASIAVPSYANYVKRANRAEAQSVMMEAAQYMQRFYAVNNAFNKNVDGVPVNALPAHLSQAPRRGGKTHSIALKDLSEHSYTLELTAAPDYQEPCGTMTLKHTGVKGVKGADSGMTVSNCWR